MKPPQYHQSYKKEQVASNDVDWKLFKRLMPYLWPHRWYLGLAIILLILARACEVVMPILLGTLVKRIFSTDFSEKRSELMNIGAIILTLLFFSYILDAITAVIKSWAGQKAIYNLRNDLFAHIQKLPLSFYDTNSVGRLMTRTVHDVDQINQMFTESVVPVVGNLFLFIGIILGLFYINWKATLAISIVFPCLYFLTSWFQYNQRKGYEKVRTIASAMNVFAQEHLMGGSIIRNFGLQKAEKAKFEEINDDYCTANLETVNHFAYFIAGIDFLQNLALAILFVALYFISVTFDVGTFFAFSLYALMIFRPLWDLADRYNILQSAMAAAQRVFDILNTPIEQGNSKQVTDGYMAIPEIHLISFQNVWFAYEKENWILKGISFDIKNGESLAIVGTTGAGKTTLMSILLRFYEIQKGSILINGIDYREFPLHILRQQFSVVPQDPVIFSGTIYDNIALYDSSISKSDIENIINDLGMKELIERYPDCLQHVLTERGGSLSAGERQLISLTRAVAHNRNVLILDEATANIDTHTEKVIQEALKKLLVQQTSLVIAHRLSTVRDVSRILVLQAGLVAESGTHDELIKSKGIYEKLYRLQFAD